MSEKFDVVVIGTGSAGMATLTHTPSPMGFLNRGNVCRKSPPSEHDLLGPVISCCGFMYAE